MTQSRWISKPLDGYRMKDLPTEEDAELTHVGPGTPGGEYFRRFWLPVAMASQLADKPVPIRVLGEDLVIFRDLRGEVGLVHRHCAHRRMSLEFGRIEQRGIRCAYHGWLYDTDGSILEVPGEPEGSAIPAKVCLGAYPVHEIKGLVFAYMGPAEERPEFPFFDCFDLPGHEMVPYSIGSPCNWLQESENAVDPVHSVFLHGRVNGPQFPGLENFVNLPIVRYRDVPSGIVYSHARRVDDRVWIRFHDHFLPTLAQNGGMFQAYTEPVFFGRPSLTKWVVPVDDTHSRKFGWRHFNDSVEVLRLGKREDVGWESVDFYGQTGARSYRERQANPGDWEAWVGQGPINIHGREFLGTTDRGVVMLRRRLRKDIRAVANGESIVRPQGTPEHPFKTYGGDTVLRIPKRNDDDEGLLAEVQDKVFDIYLSGDAYEGGEREEFIRSQLRTLSQ